jgi:uncharacterized membrane protein YbaN (DUF454 family)
MEQEATALPNQQAQAGHKEAVPSRTRFARGLLVGAGIASVGLGILGVVLPVLPTTPFLLLAAACFARSSERLHRWLHENRVFGEYLRRYRAGEGLPLSSKVTTIVILWASLAVSAYLIPPGARWVWAVLALVGTGVTVHIARIKSRRGGAQGTRTTVTSSFSSSGRASTDR